MTPKYQVDQKVITPLGIGRIVDIGLETFSFFYLVNIPYAYSNPKRFGEALWVPYSGIVPNEN